MKNITLLAIVFLVYSAPALAQAPKIVYAEPEREDNRRTDFEIIGKVGGNFLIYKNNRRTDHAISVYDNEMKLKERVSLDYISDRWINVDFVTYAEHAFLIYQYQKRSVVYCTAVKIDGNGKTIGEPFTLDTTHIGFASDNKIYTTINSDDKQRIMIFKVNSRNPKHFIFTTLLFDAQLVLQRRSIINMDMEERNDFFTDFMLSNDGEMIFAKFIRSSSTSEYISKVFMIIKPAEADSFSIRDIGMGERILDELKLKIDNTGKKVLFNAFYYKQRRGNIEGIYMLNWDIKASAKVRDTALAFNDELRGQAKGPDANKKIAFNDYFIKNVVVRRDGGFLVMSESLYSTSRGSTFNRWDYYNWGSPWMSPYNSYWSPYYSPWYMPWGRSGMQQNTRYYAENIMIQSFNKDGQLEWSSVIPKTQYDDDSDNMISYQVVNTGGEIHFLFNQYERRTQLLNDNTVDASGKITRNPTLKNLDKGYEFMPRFGKQVSSRQLVVPCLYRNYLCFAKIEF